MNLTKEEKDFIINLSHEMKTQDNRCTAQPYGLTILQDRESPIQADYTDKFQAIVKLYNDKEHPFQCGGG